MKKIMFNSRYGLEEAVVERRKTKTRRNTPKSLPETIRQGYDRLEIFNGKELRCYNGAGAFIKYNLPYQIGEVVAVAQSYSNAGFGDIAPIIGLDENDMPIFASEEGVYNKMFVRADLMPHQIRITNVRGERLNEITEDDCRREGIDSWMCQGKRFFGFFDNAKDRFSRHNTPREAYAALIDRISGKGTWEKNPWVFAYDFELVK